MTATCGRKTAWRSHRHTFLQLCQHFSHFRCHSGIPLAIAVILMKTLLHASSVLCSTALITTLIWGNDAQAQAGNYALRSGDELVSACRLSKPETKEGDGLCEGFLVGYLQAHPEVGFRDDLPSEYMQRVMRTRAPARTIPLTRITYCLEGKESLAHIHEAIAALEPMSVAADTPASVVEDILERDFRCPS